MEYSEFSIGLQEIGLINYFLKLCFINICTYYTTERITNVKTSKLLKWMVLVLEIIIVSAIATYFKYVTTIIFSTTVSLILMIFLYKFKSKSRLSYSILIIVISTSINYIIFIISVALNYYPSVILNINDNYLSFLGIAIIYLSLLCFIVKRNKIKYGIQFLQKNTKDDYINMLILNVSSIIFFIIILLQNSDIKLSRTLLIYFAIFSVIMFITIKKSLQLYYKQKMLIKDLNETREELEKKKKEIAELEAENIEISKKRHTIVHKQKSIEHKLEELLMKTEISKEESAEVKERLEKLHTQIYSEKEKTSLDKTGISNIDDMLNYMQSECIKNKIEFTLVIK